MLLHLFSAAQDEDIRSKNTSVFIFLTLCHACCPYIKTCQMHTTGKGDLM